MSSLLKTGLAAVLVVLAFVLLYLSIAKTESPDKSPFALLPADKVQAAPDFTLPDAATGRPVHLLAEAKSRPVVLDFWATWCGPCRSEMPHLNALARKYGGRVAFYGMNSDDPPAKIVAFAQASGLAYPTLSDAHKSAASRYGADAIPLLIVIDTHGNVRVASQGVDPDVDMEASLGKSLDTLLAGG